MTAQMPPSIQLRQILPILMIHGADSIAAWVSFEMDGDATLALGFHQLAARRRFRGSPTAPPPLPRQSIRLELPAHSVRLARTPALCPPLQTLSSPKRGSHRRSFHSPPARRQVYRETAASKNAAILRNRAAFAESGS